LRRLDRHSWRVLQLAHTFGMVRPQIANHSEPATLPKQSDWLAFF
jgi:hypothetical protein